MMSDDELDDVEQKALDGCTASAIVLLTYAIHDMAKQLHFISKDTRAMADVVKRESGERKG